MKTTRLQQRLAKQMIQARAQEWMEERGFRPMTDEEIAEAARRKEAEKGGNDEPA